MIHHVSVGSNDIARAKRFYDAVLPIVGLLPMKATDTGLDYGSGQFQFSVETPVDGKPASVGNGSHIAFAAEDRAMVDRFHAAALAHGGTSDGEPGLRPEYDANYYGAFVRDPDGNKIEAVTYAAR
ncbi:VOC family protein [Geminicoccus flavidas]|uniref:VOC family protein n=1 Tax=Geminicoccus flavidas TaxID=2506407 RepID=UPI0013597B82|nr:VOC family protein [Geminicoccus flavidas]